MYVVAYYVYCLVASRELCCVLRIIYIYIYIYMYMYLCLYVHYYFVVQNILHISIIMYVLTCDLHLFVSVNKLHRYVFI